MSCHPNLDLYLYPNRYLDLYRYQVLIGKERSEREVMDLGERRRLKVAHTKDCAEAQVGGAVPPYSSSEARC